MLKFEASGNTLLIDDSNPKYCECRLITAKDSILLGHLPLDLVSCRLLAGLLEAPAEDSVIRLGGRPVRWAGSFEPHGYVFYVRHQGDVRTILVEDGNECEIVHAFELSTDELSAWVSALEKLSSCSGTE